MADRQDAPEDSADQPVTDGFDLLLSLRGSGRALWADEHADVYVGRLREGWA